MNFLEEVYNSPKNFLEKLYNRDQSGKIISNYILDHTDNINIEVKKVLSENVYLTNNNNIVRKKEISPSVEFKGEIKFPLKDLIENMNFYDKNLIPNMSDVEHISLDDFTLNFFVSNFIDNDFIFKTDKLLIENKDIYLILNDCNENDIYVFEECESQKTYGYFINSYDDNILTLLNIGSGFYLENFNKYFIVDVEDSFQSLEEKEKYIFLKDNFILNLVRQCTTLLNYLQENYNFFHGQLESSNILINSEPFDKYNFGIMLKGFNNSSLSFEDSNEQKVHIFNNNNQGEIYSIEKIENNTIYYLEGDITSSIDYYKLPNSFNKDTLHSILSMGSFFYPSFDTYTMILSILSIPEIFERFSKSELLKEIIWDPLWIDEKDSDIIYLKIKSSVNQDLYLDYYSLVELLKNTKLKINVTQDLLKNLMKYDYLN